MDLSSTTGNGNRGQFKKPQIEYTAVASSSLVSGEVKLVIDENALIVTTLFDVAEIPFVEMNALKFTDYTVTIKSDNGDFSFSRMGHWGQPFYDALYDAYNKTVLRSLFVAENPIFITSGDYRYAEDGKNISGFAPIHIYENCVTFLPPDLGARRIPLCFTVGLDKSTYELTLKLNTGESYTFAKLGYDSASFADTVEKQLKKLREKALAAVKEFDPSLTQAHASGIAKLMPEGVAAPLEKLAAVAPSFVTAIEARLAATRIDASYKVFKQLCDPTQIYVGFKKSAITPDNIKIAENLSATSNCILGNTNSVNPLLALNGILDGETGKPAAFPPHGGNDPAQSATAIWLIAPSPDGQYAVVEFSEANSATFVYHTGGDFPRFATQLNHALEAINWRREIIRLTDEELIKPENAYYYMATRRSASLQFVRANFAGRIIHSNLESWKEKLLTLWNANTSTQGQYSPKPAQPKLCWQCGTALAPLVKFCGMCGAKAI